MKMGRILLILLVLFVSTDTVFAASFEQGMSIAAGAVILLFLIFFFSTMAKHKSHPSERSSSHDQKTKKEEHQRKQDKTDLAKQIKEYNADLQNFQQMRSQYGDDDPRVVELGRVMQQRHAELTALLQSMQQQDDEERRNIDQTQREDTTREGVINEDIKTEARSFAYIERELHALERALGHASRDDGGAIVERIQNAREQLGLLKSALTDNHLELDIIQGAINAERNAIRALSAEENKIDRFINDLKRLPLIQDHDRKVNHIQWLHTPLHDLTATKWKLDADVQKFLELHERIKALERNRADYFERSREMIQEFEQRHRTNQEVPQQFLLRPEHYQ
ncbi:hypothetical protein GOV09_02605 [Candidatus Woesearchaeota archaeon]|nr:hypothetical protein [Candidatus Woesearchaeota archaeon]